jgi:hypothetical protein
MTALQEALSQAEKQIADLQAQQQTEAENTLKLQELLSQKKEEWAHKEKSLETKLES